MRLNKLFFDDIRPAPGPDWDVARNVEEAKKLLSEKEYDVVFLDHDIDFSCDQPTGPDEPTGTDLAWWMCNNFKNMHTTIVIHSFNSAGAQRMKNILLGFNVQVSPYMSLAYNVTLRLIEDYGAIH